MSCVIVENQQIKNKLCISLYFFLSLFENQRQNE
jgi:hypothetical protein